MIRGDNPCRWCVGACCRNPEIIELDRPEYDALIEASTQLDILATNGEAWDDVSTVIFDPERLDKTYQSMARTLKVGRALAQFVSLCGNLDPINFSCKIWDKDTKPSACGALPPNGLGCDSARVEHGVILSGTKIVLTDKPNW